MGLINMAIPSLFLGLGYSAGSEEITVISGGAIEPGLKAAVAAFEKQTGQKVNITFKTAPQMREQIASGDTYEVVIAPPAVIVECAKTGKVESGGVDVGRVGSGVAIRPGAPVPAITTADDIRNTVLEAESIVFNLASTGIYFENLLKKMGVWDQVKPKTTRYATGSEVMKHALKGKGREVAFGPITEILLEKEHGLVFVGPLPPEVQNYTSYTAVPMSTCSQLDAAQALLEFLSGPLGKPLFAAMGIE